MHILTLEPYYGGSHRSFLEGLQKHSRHEFDLLTLPARKWKWRMRGAAIWFAEQLAARDKAEYDAIFTCDMVSVADLRSLLVGGLRDLPLVCYFHENQLTYPLPDEGDRDYQYAFTNITSCLAADRVWFNSRYHLESFLVAAGGLLRQMPDAVPPSLVSAIGSKATVRYPGIAWIGPEGRDRPGNEPKTVLWNHRWEYDKNPDEFFQAVFDLADQGIPFRLMVAGEQFRTCPPVFEEARQRLSDRIIHWGYANTVQAYARLLRSADIVVSSAIHEFFGISVLEAVSAGCRAVLPRRLTYPELFPEGTSAITFYDSPADLTTTLHEHLLDSSPPTANAIAELAAPFAWQTRIAEFDRAFEQLLV